MATINGGAVVAGSPPTIAFAADRRVSGTTGCNQYSALFSTDGLKLTIGAMQSTLMLCAGPVGDQEVAFLNGFGGANAWRINEAGDLEIDGAASIVAHPGIGAAQAPSAGAGLGGTHWTLAELGATADFAHIVPTLEFGSDGSVSGFAGCNTFSGTFTTDGDALSLGPLATTEIGCQRPASAVEADYLQALSGVTMWSIGSDGRLTLGGAVPMRFAPA